MGSVVSGGQCHAPGCGISEKWANNYEDQLAVSRARDGKMRVLCRVSDKQQHSSADERGWILGKPQGLAHTAEGTSSAEMVYNAVRGQMRIHVIVYLYLPPMW